MIKRRYFLSVKIAHNNNTGQYSWWNTIINTVGFFEDVDELLKSAREMSVSVMSHRLDREIEIEDVEILSLNRI